MKMTVGSMEGSIGRAIVRLTMMRCILTRATLECAVSKEEWGGEDVTYVANTEPVRSRNLAPRHYKASEQWGNRDTTSRESHVLEMSCIEDHYSGSWKSSLNAWGRHSSP